MAGLALHTLLAVFSASQLASGLQVAPNSPCSSVCRDSLDLDASDPNSSSTRNSDITCQDAAYSSAAGTKFKSCMTCLQTSTFSQGSESDMKWFLYNLRYTAAYCLFGFPNATDISSTPCITETACGPLRASLEHGILKPSDSTAYSYCSVGGKALDLAPFEHCIPCISAGSTAKYLANYFVALEAGCRQQPAPGLRLGLNDTIFSSARISIVDPTTLVEDKKSEPTLGTPAIAGIAAGGVVLILIIAAVTFVCLRKRRNKRVRASAEADFYNKVRRHHSSMSFQCQTHMISPRFWPGAAGDGVATPAMDSPDTQAHRSSIWKPHESELDDNTAHISKKAAMAAVPLHQITTTVLPPPQAYSSPSSEKVYHSPSDFRSPLSAESVRSTSALLPSIKPYVPAEHGVHVQGSPHNTFDSPTPTTPGGAGTGTGMTPLLKSHGWPLPEPSLAPQHHRREEQQQQKPQRNIITFDKSVPPPPPPLKTSRSSGLLTGRKSPKTVGTGSPVESWEIQTAFAAPPKR
ncbi:hypothetical protein N657DRAFT_631660 [Parathielavia appendiculata]|uniref:LPXTG-domain-containing protein n=1 Tax=Parathielavia appendiculata TaxID=2587402 RepID=A0AAN6U7L6_9PEZI|nr:hypothetical protein N657DRAFT_631660 [Parathielavia appendiculata]